MSPPPSPSLFKVGVQLIFESLQVKVSGLKRCLFLRLWEVPAEQCFQASLRVCSDVGFWKAPNSIS